MIFYKMNRKTRKVENVSVVFSEKQRMQMVYDPLNPDYIIYKTDEGNLVRKRIF